MNIGYRFFATQFVETGRTSDPCLHSLVVSVCVWTCQNCTRAYILWMHDVAKSLQTLEQIIHIFLRVFAQIVGSHKILSSVRVHCFSTGTCLQDFNPIMPHIGLGLGFWMGICAGLSDPSKLTKQITIFRRI